jgi:hypothetical protein
MRHLEVGAFTTRPSAPRTKPVGRGWR